MLQFISSGNSILPSQRARTIYRRWAIRWADRSDVGTGGWPSRHRRPSPPEFSRIKGMKPAWSVPFGWMDLGVHVLESKQNFSPPHKCGLTDEHWRIPLHVTPWAKIHHVPLQRLQPVPPTARISSSSPRRENGPPFQAVHGGRATQARRTNAGRLFSRVGFLLAESDSLPTLGRDKESSVQ